MDGVEVGDSDESRAFLHKPLPVPFKSRRTVAISKVVSADAIALLAAEQPASPLLQFPLPFLSVFPSPFSLSTLCTFMPSLPSASHTSVVGFSSVNSLTSVSFSTNLSPTDVVAKHDSKLPAEGLTSPAAALVSALQSFLALERPLLQLAKGKSSRESVLSMDQPRNEGGNRSTEKEAKSKSFKMVTFSLRNRPKETVPNFAQEKIGGNNIQTITLKVNQVKVVTSHSSAKHEDEVDDPASDQERRISNGEKAKNVTKHLMAGAMSTVVARTFVAPLERLKLEYIICGATQNWAQVLHTIVKNEGFGGFWKGNTVNLLRMVPFKSINFLAYDEYCKHVVERCGKEEVTNLDRLAAGAASGATATLICLPLDTIRTRLIAPGGEALGGMLGCLQHMVHREGFFSLYKGLLPALLSMAPSGAVFYGVYDILKASYLHSPEGQKELQRKIERELEKQKVAYGGETEAFKSGKDANVQLDLGPVRTLLYGAIAGACAESVTYPLEVVRRQLQLQQTATKMGLLATFQGIIERDGVGALFAGLIPSILQVLPSAALSYLVYESMKVVLKVT